MMVLLARLTVWLGWDCLLSNTKYYKEYWRLFRIEENKNEKRK